MKRMICALFLLALLLTGCGSGAVTIDDSAFLPDTTAMLDGLLAEDFDACREVITTQVDDQTLRSAVAQMSQLLGGVDSYTLKAVGWNKNIHNGISQSSVNYEMQTEAGRFLVQAVMVEGVDGLAGFQISPVEEVVVTGAPGAMEGAGAVQWLMLIFGVAEYGFVLWMAVDCLRHKFKGRIGWLLLILLFSSIFTLSIAGGKLTFDFKFGIYLHLSNLLKDSAGMMALKLYVPLGAILYWFQRKKLHVPKAAEGLNTGEEETNGEIQENP